MEARIDLYPGDLALEDVPAEFSLETIPADRSVGEAGGIWATLENIPLGGPTMPSEQVLLMNGRRALKRIEKEKFEQLKPEQPIVAR